MQMPVHIVAAFDIKKQLIAVIYKKRRGDIS